MKYLIYAGIGYFIYQNLNQKYQLALKDRDALLAMLTPEQRANLLQGIQAAQAAASGVVQAAVSNTQAAVTNPQTSSSAPSTPITPQDSSIPLTSVPTGPAIAPTDQSVLMSKG